MRSHSLNRFNVSLFGMLWLSTQCGPIANKNRDNATEFGSANSKGQETIGLSQPTSTGGVATGDPMIVKAGLKEGSYRIFTSDEQQGYCYRIPSFVRAGRFVVAIAQKRKGNTESKMSNADNQRPVREGKAINTIPACNDEALTSIVIRMAVVPRSASSPNLMFQVWT
ncbi:hypothetical protein EBR21_14405, partial [bacterium]|nr:hypothetical protein [bacterium]